MSIFPELPLIVEDEGEVIKSCNPCFDFKSKRMMISDGKIVMVTGKDKIKQWIELLIRTEMDKYRVYLNTEFGLADLYNLRGHQLFTSNYGISEMKRELKEKIETKNEVTSVENIGITYEFDRLKIELTVIVEGETLISEVMI